MRVRSILAISTTLLLAGPALAGMSAGPGGGGSPGCCGGPVGGSDVSPSGGHITAPGAIPGPGFEGQMKAVDPADLGGGFTPRGDPDDGAPGVGHNGVSGNSNSPDGPGGGNGK